MLEEVTSLSIGRAAQIGQTTRKAKKANTHTIIRKLTKTQQKNTNENVHSITTCKKRQQKKRSRFLREYKSETSYTPEDCRRPKHVV
jgi:hypothetical protein